eukprot:15456334-Alexandrium_andersonii.AAC.1
MASPPGRSCRLAGLACWRAGRVEGPGVGDGVGVARRVGPPARAPHRGHCRPVGHRGRSARSAVGRCSARARPRAAQSGA